MILVDWAIQPVPQKGRSSGSFFRLEELCLDLDSAELRWVSARRGCKACQHPCFWIRPPISRKSAATAKTSSVHWKEPMTLQNYCSSTSKANEVCLRGRHSGVDKNHGQASQDQFDNLKVERINDTGKPFQRLSHVQSNSEPQR